MIDFKFEVTLGQVIEAVAVVIALVKWSNKLGRMEQKVNIMYRWWANHLKITGYNGEAEISGD